VVLDDLVVDAIDRVAGKRSRSRFLEDAAREKLARLELEATLRKTAATVDRKGHPDWADAKGHGEVGTGDSRQRGAMVW
jgi:hypothetical protein